MSPYYVYDQWIRLMYDKYEHGDPKVVLSVNRVMGLCLHMAQVQPRVTYVITLLWCGDLDIWLCMSIMSCNEWYMHYDYVWRLCFVDVLRLCLINYMWVLKDFCSPTHLKNDVQKCIKHGFN